MSNDPRRPRGAAALAEIIERLKGLGAEVEKAVESGGVKQDGFDVETSFGRMSGRYGVRVGPAAAPSRRPSKPAASKPAAKAAEPLVDIHFDGRSVVVTTETDDPAAHVSVDDEGLKIRAARAPERRVALPCRVAPDSLRVTIVNGVLEATMAAEESAQ